MLPKIHFHLNFFGQTSHSFSTQAVLGLLCLLAALVFYGYGLRKDIHPFKSIVLVISLAFATLLGGRLFHVIWERPGFFIKNPDLIFTQLDGMTYYGSLMAMGTVLYFGVKKLSASILIQGKILDFTAITLAFSYGVLRIGCFAEGCCWGSLSAVPWAVRYTDPTSVMPALGLPVHPVQLYDSFIGFLIFGVLIYLYQRVNLSKGKLIYVYCLLYPLGRFFTENFRGDGFRGVDLFLGLSTSQLLSIALAVFGFSCLIGFKTLRDSGDASHAESVS